jgi:hypothetical protein
VDRAGDHRGGLRRLLLRVVPARDDADVEITGLFFVCFLLLLSPLFRELAKDTKKKFFWTVEEILGRWMAQRSTTRRVIARVDKKKWNGLVIIRNK